MTLQSFPCNYTLLMLCNFQRQNLGCSDRIIDISWWCFFPMASTKRLCLIMFRLGFLSPRLSEVTGHGHSSTLQKPQNIFFCNARQHQSLEMWHYHTRICAFFSTLVHRFYATNVAIVKVECCCSFQALCFLFTSFIISSDHRKENWKMFTIYRA